MKLPDFLVEQWMNDYEGQAVYNLTDTCVKPLQLQQLLALDVNCMLESIKLDYGVITGDPLLKKEIIKLYQNASPEEVTTVQGCLLANQLVMETLLKPGDRVLAYAPSYQQFQSLPESYGCTVELLPLKEEKGWLPREQDLEAAFQKPVRLVILNNPNNPTGTLFPDAYLKKLIALAKSQDAWILADEVYRDPAYPSLSDQYEKAVSTASLSKMYSLAGLRLGWIRGSKELIHEINVRRDYEMISTGPLADRLGAIALQHSEELLQRSRGIIEDNCKVIRTWLRQEPRAALVMPETGTVSLLKYTAPVHSRELAAGLLKKYGVFFVPGSCFGCENHLRLGLTADAGTMAKGLQMLSRYLDECEYHSTASQ
jgi:aspartate/methionine/tyrosine aminotransferase